jgi:Domain of unknown function (DUF3850)
MTTHRIKCDPQPFKELLEGVKKAELRYNDRGYKAGDTLVLEETKCSEAERKAQETNSAGLYIKTEHKLTGRAINALVTHVIDDSNPWGGLGKGWVVLSLHGAFLVQPEFERRPGILCAKCGAIVESERKEA